MNLHHLPEQNLLALTRDEDYTFLEYALHIDAKALYDRTIHRFAGPLQRWDRFSISDKFLSLELNVRLWLFPIPTTRKSVHYAWKRRDTTGCTG